LNYVTDFDDAVGAMAARSFTALVGSAPRDVRESAAGIHFNRPSNNGALPKKAEIQLESGTVQLRLLSDVAPVTIARFAELAASGAYDGKTFHRIVPNFVVQGGSPARTNTRAPHPASCGTRWVRAHGIFVALSASPHAGRHG
jgi:hypothetical protein